MKILKKLVITDNRAEMEQIGQEIVQVNPEIYTSKMMDRIGKTLDLTFIGSPAERLKRIYRSVYNYWAFGDTINEDVYYNFDKLTADEKNKYMTMRWRYIYTYHLNDRNLEHFFNNKFETYKLFKEYYLRDVIELRSEKNYSEFVDFAKKHKSFVVKPSDLTCGYGVYRVDIEKTTDLKQLFDSIIVKRKEANNSFVTEHDNSVVLEELIIQDKSLEIFHPSSVNAIRITTIRVGNKIIIYYPWIKIGAKGSFIATAVIGGMDAGIDPDTGVINTYGYGELHNIYKSHPDTGIDFIGYKIPQWKELIAMIKKIALSLPIGVNYVGWDVVLTEKGWCIMEGNFTGDFIWQLFLQKGMRKEFEELIGWKSDKQFWWE